MPSHDACPAGSSPGAGTPGASSTQSSRIAYADSSRGKGGSHRSQNGAQWLCSWARSSLAQTVAEVKADLHSFPGELRFPNSKTLLVFWLSIRCTIPQAMRSADLSRRVPFQGALTGPASMAHFAPPDRPEREIEYWNKVTFSLNTYYDIFTGH